MIEQGHSLFVVSGRIETPESLRWLHIMSHPLRSYGMDVEVHNVGWRNSSGDFISKLEELGDKVEYKLNKNDKVSLLGISAGGSMAVNVFMEYPEISGVVTIGSRLNLIEARTFPSIEEVQHTDPLYIESVKWLEEHNAYLNSQMRKRIMTMRPLSGDDHAPSEAMHLEGAREEVIVYEARNHNNGVVKILQGNAETIGSFLKEG